MARPNWLLLAGLALLSACYLPEEREPVGVRLDLNDPLSRRLIDWQDHRQTDSLLAYLDHEDPTYRFLAARAFGSYLDPEAIDSLVAHLDDPNDLVREQVAYALGQQSEPKVVSQLIQAFESENQAFTFERANAAILEAVGRLGGAEELKLLSTIDFYQPTDSLLVAGRARGILRFGMRGTTSAAGTSAQLDMALDSLYPGQARVAAAEYLHLYADRLNEEQLDRLAAYLAPSSAGEVDQRLAQVLARLGRGAHFNRLKELLNSPDPVLRASLVSELSPQAYPVLAADLRLLLREDPSHLVRVAAAEYFLRHGRESDATGYARLAQDSLQGREAWLMYAAAQRHLPYYLSDYRIEINNLLQQAFNSTEDPYQQRFLLLAMAEFPWNYRIIHDLGFTHPETFVRSGAVEALALISNFDRFDEFFGVSRRRVRTELSIYFRQAIESLDVGMVYFASVALQDLPDIYRPFYQQLDWARSSLAALQLPRDLESHRELDRAIELLETGKMSDRLEPPAYNHPIQWNILESAGSRPLVRMRTEYGNVDIRLFPEEAPATVSAFLDQVAHGFYNGKAIHRVVPGWVTQGGDPRGDGFGAADWSIRTETPHIHFDRAGLLGAPNGGPDTESIQLFFTHGATPTLDGRFTLFGEVVEGLDALLQMRIGDTIERIELL